MDGENTIRPVFKKDESITDLLGKITSGSATLVREEVQLARQEMREGFQALTAGAVTTAIGAVLGSVAFLTLWSAFLVWLCLFWPAPVVMAVAGAALGLMGAAVIFTGLRLLQKTTAESVRTVAALEGREGTDGNQRVV
jgi:hypothetical protein